MSTLLVVVLFTSASATADTTKVSCIDANTKAQDLRRDGKFAAAREQLRRCLDPACPVLVRDDCAKRLDELDRAQPTVVFEAKDPDGKDLTAVTISADGKRLADSITGTALEVDPGAHALVFQAAGRPAVTQEIVLHEAEKGRTDLVIIGGGAAGKGSSAAPRGEHGPASQGSTQRTIGLVGVGAGAASLAAGAVFGALTIAAHSSYEKDCGSNIGAPAGQCNQQGISGQSDAAMKGTLSTVFFAAGGVAVGAGAALFFTAPSSAGVQVGLGPSGALLRGVW